MRKLIKKHRWLFHLTKIIYFTFANLLQKDFDSAKYWEKRYKKGGGSGLGSYNELAQFKAEVINKFVCDNKINTVIEFGCGDGNQLGLADYPCYIGVDVSETVIQQCRKIYQGDKSKSFQNLHEFDNACAELVLSLDVIYHLVEDDIYEEYIERLFSSAKNYVVIYSSNTNLQDKYQSQHIKHRKFTKDIQHLQAWKLTKVIRNPYPANGNDLTTSSADFYIYENRPG